MVRGIENLYVGIIDDDESQLRSFARLLRAAGMQPIMYSSAEEFRADLKRPSFDCLVLDVQLPGMSGIALRNLLSKEGIITPVIFVTAHDDSQAREAALAGQCAGFFFKSDAGRDILDAILSISGAAAK